MTPSAPAPAPAPSPSYSHGTSTTPLLGDTVGANLDRAIAAYPDREALVDVPSGRRWTYTGFGAAVDEVARGLLAKGITTGDRVGIWAVNCPEWVLTQYATARIGAIMVNINPAYRAHELEYVLRQAGAPVTLEDLRAFCADRLAHYKVPSRLQVLESFPMTVSGKVRKVELRERYAPGTAEGVEGWAARRAEARGRVSGDGPAEHLPGTAFRTGFGRFGGEEAEALVEDACAAGRRPGVVGPEGDHLDPAGAPYPPARRVRHQRTADALSPRPVRDDEPVDVVGRRLGSEQQPAEETRARARGVDGDERHGRAEVRAHRVVETGYPDHGAEPLLDLGRQVEEPGEVLLRRCSDHHASRVAGVCPGGHGRPRLRDMHTRGHRSSPCPPSWARIRRRPGVSSASASVRKPRRA